jgi:transcriptional regulator with XRE-family HTH domain
MGNIVALLLDDAMPPGRLGELLRAARKRRGLKRKQVAARTGTTADQLRAYERGTLEIPADVCTRLVECYGDDLLAHVPRREPLPVTAAGSEDEILTDFVQLVRRLRRAKPGAPLPLRAADVAALASALDADPGTIEQRIMDVLGCSRDEARTLHRELLRRKIVLPVAGLAASVVAIAGVQAAQASSGRPPVMPAHEVHGPVTAPPTTAITLAPTTTVAVPTRVTPTTRPAHNPSPAPSTPRPTHVTSPAPLPAAHNPPPGGWYPLPDTDEPPPENVTPPSIDPNDNTPVSILPGETPITAISTAISTVPPPDEG